MSRNFWCDDCSIYFDEDEAGTYTEWEGEGSMRGAINYIVCPCCNGDNLSDAVLCKWCNEYVGEYQVNGAGLCKECQKEFAEAFDKAIDNLWNDRDRYDEVMDLFLDFVQDKYLGGL